MKALILAIATMLALAAGLTTGAAASNHKAGRGGSHLGHVHTGGTRGFGVRHGSRFATRGGWEVGNAYGYGEPKSLGPLGFTFGCVHGYCGQGYSIPAWTY